MTTPADIFDSHAHLISADTDRYPTSPLKGALDRVLVPFTAEDLIRQMDENHVQRAVVVQRAHVYGFNNAYAADSAAQYPGRLVSVGMIDSLDPEAPQLARHWITERGMRGIRMTEAIKGSDSGWVSGPIARDVWAVATELKASVCFHFMSWNRGQCLTALKEMCELFPTTTVVVDHFSNLSADPGAPNLGVDRPLQDLVQFPNLVQKFTTINIAKLADQGLPAAPVIERMVQSFGANRVMWGSDVAQSKGSYASMVQHAQEATVSLTHTERRQVLYETATALYG